MTAPAAAKAAPISPLSRRTSARRRAGGPVYASGTLTSSSSYQATVCKMGTYYEQAMNLIPENSAIQWSLLWEALDALRACSAWIL